MQRLSCTFLGLGLLIHTISGNGTYSRTVPAIKGNLAWKALKVNFQNEDDGDDLCYLVWASRLYE